MYLPLSYPHTHSYVSPLMSFFFLKLYTQHNIWHDDWSQKLFVKKLSDRMNEYCVQAQWCKVNSMAFGITTMSSNPAFYHYNVNFWAIYLKSEDVSFLFFSFSTKQGYNSILRCFSHKNEPKYENVWYVTEWLHEYLFSIFLLLYQNSMRNLYIRHLHFREESKGASRRISLYIINSRLGLRTKMYYDAT